MNNDNTTVIICCAGMGTRLGIGTTKALVNICDKPLIIRLLEHFKDYSDIRIVVGFQAEKLINIVKDYRKDIIFAFNYDYENNGPAASMWKGLKNAKENVIVLDGDIVIEKNSFKEFLNCEDECIAYSTIKTDEPIYVNINDNKVIHFSIKETKYIWPGIIKIKKEKIEKGNNYVFETIENSLPLKAINIDAMEIDTQDDYEHVINWYKKEDRGDSNE